MKSTSKRSTLRPISRSFKPILEELEPRIQLTVDLTPVETELPSFLNTFESGVTSSVLNQNVPFIGNSLATLPEAQAMGTIAGKVSNLNSLGAKPTSDAVVTALKKDLSGFSNVSVTASGDNTATSTSNVIFDVKLTQNTQAGSTKADFTTGLPNLGFKINSQGVIQETVGYTVHLIFGVDSSGFFIDTSPTDQLALNVGASIAPGASLKGTFGLVTISAADQGSAFNGTYEVNATGGIIRATSSSQFGTLNLSSDLNVTTLKVLLGLDASTNAFVDLGLKATLSIDWSSFNDDPRNAGTANFGGSAPNVQLQNVTLNTGTLLKQFVGTILGQISQVTTPLQQLSNALSGRPIPELPLTYLDLLELASTLSSDSSSGPPDGGNIEQLLQILNNDAKNDPLTSLLNLVSEIGDLQNAASAGGSGTINLGSFSLNDVRDTSVDFAAGTAGSDVEDQLPDSFGTLESRFKKDVNADGGTFNLDILTDSRQAVKLFLGQTATLFTFSLPTYEKTFASTDFHYNTVIGIVPVTFNFSSGIKLRVQLNFGYDTTGFNEYSQSGRASDLLDGFYLDTSGGAPFSISGDAEDAQGNDDALIHMDAGVGFEDDLKGLLSQFGVSIPNWVPLPPIGASFKPVDGNVDLIGNLSLTPEGSSNGKVRYSDIVKAGDDLSCLLDPTGNLHVTAQVTFDAEIHAVLTDGVTVTDWKGNKHTFGRIAFDAKYIRDLSPKLDEDLYNFSTNCGPASSAGAALSPPIVHIKTSTGTTDPQSAITVNEGDTVTLDASGSTGAGSLQYSWQQIQIPGMLTPYSVALANATSPSVSFVPYGGTIPANNLSLIGIGPLAFQVTVYDTATGLSSSKVVYVDVNNIGPTVTLTRPTHAIEGLPASFVADFSDPGETGPPAIKQAAGGSIYRGSWSFGDANNTGDISDQLVDEPTATASHVYPYAGSYNVSTTVTDIDPWPHPGSANLPDLNVTVADEVADPNDPTKTDLIVGGTPGDDTIVLKRDGSNGDVIVAMGRYQQEFAAPTGDIEVYGFGGNNKLVLDFSNGQFIPDDQGDIGGLIFDGGDGQNQDGGDGQNQIETIGGNFNIVAANAPDPQSGVGSLFFDDVRVTYQNVQSVNEASQASQLIVNTPTGTSAINIVDGDPINGTATTQINAGSNTAFPVLNFANKGIVVVNGQGGAESFTVNNAHPAAGLTTLDLNGSNSANGSSGAGNSFFVKADVIPNTTINVGSGTNTVTLRDANDSLNAITSAFTINGSGPSNTLNVSNNADFTLTDQSLSSGGFSAALSGMQTANLTGGPDNNTFDVSGWSGSGSLDGQAGNNTVVAENDGNFTLTNTSLGRSGRGNLRLESIQNAQLIGGSGDNVFDVSKWFGNATLDGKGGNNTYNYAVDGGSVSIIDSAKSGIDSAVITGTDSGDTFNITPSQLTDGLDTVTYDKTLDNLSVNGGSASDVFNVNPSATATIIVDGGTPPPPTSPGDTLNLDLTGAAGAFRTATPTAAGYQGSWTFANRQAVNFSHMETLTPALHLSGAGTPINGFEYSALNGTLAANFTNANFLVPASDFVASIDWGDGTVTAGTITLSGNTYQITGSHMYTDESTYTVKITVSGDLTSAHFTTTATMLEELLPDGTRGTANQRFISELYRDLLGHPVDQGSLDFWNNLLNLGLPQTFVVLGIESTPEYQQLQVQSLYQRYLQRQADSFELSLGTDFLLAGGTPEQLAMYLVGTPEFFFQQGGGSLNGFLSALYQDALQSPIVAQAEMTDLAALAQGTSLSDVVQNVFQLPGYQQGVVNDLILQLLDRNPTGADASDLTLALETGLPDDVVLALLATSTPYQEYFDKTA